MFRRVLQQNCIAIPTTLIRRKPFDEVRGFDEALDCLEDKDLWLRLLLDGNRFHYLGENLAIYRNSAGSLSKNVSKMYRGRMRLLEKLDRVMEHPSFMTPTEWQRERRQYYEHAQWERAYGFLQNRSYGNALRYGNPAYLGLSAASLRHTSRVLLNAVLRK